MPWRRNGVMVLSEAGPEIAFLPAAAARNGRAPCAALPGRGAVRSLRFTTVYQLVVECLRLRRDRNTAGRKVLHGSFDAR